LNCTCDAITSSVKPIRFGSIHATSLIKRIDLSGIKIKIKIKIEIEIEIKIKIEIEIKIEQTLYQRKPSKQTMEPTNTHIDSIIIGDNVWVTQGKTDHMAIYFGEPRKVVVYSDSDYEDENNSSKRGTEELEVLIRWTTTGTRGYVSVSSVRPVVLGQRRRRQVVNHYQAIPSQRPAGNNNKNNNKNKKKKKKEPKHEIKIEKDTAEDEDEASKELPTREEFQKDREEKQREKEKEEPKKEYNEKQKQHPDTERRRALNNDNNEKSNSDENLGRQLNEKPKFKFKLPTKEEFQKYPERNQQKKEKKERDKKFEGKGKRQPDSEQRSYNGNNSDSDSDDDSDNDNNNNNNDNDNENGDTGNASEKLNSDNPKPLGFPTPATYYSGAINSTANAVAQDCTKQQSTVSSPTENYLGRRISGFDDDESVGIGVKTDIEIGKRRDFEDPNHTDDRGFRWEWEKPQTAQNKAKNQIPTNNNNSVDKPVPGNYGKHQPQSWDEAYAMMVKFRRTRGRDIPSDHPLLGKFVVALRWEYSKFRKHTHKQRRRNAKIENLDTAYRRANHENPRQDMTLLDSNRVKKLKKLGFKWHDPKQNESDIGTSSAGKANADVAVSSDSETDTDTSMLTIDSDNESNDKNSVSSLDDSDHYNSVDDDVNDPASSDEDDYDKDICNSHIDDHANDDEFLIVSNLKDISLADTCDRNRRLFIAGIPTLAIQLYRILRFSTLHQKLGLNKMIRWTNDGNGFRILDDSKFTENILAKTSRINNAKAFRNSLGRLNFVLVENGRNKRGGTNREYQHQSIAKAEEANDPSLRLFYRGAPLDVLWTIKTRQEERDDTGNKSKRDTEIEQKDKETSGDDDNGKGNGDMSREQDRKRRRTSDGCLLPKDGAEHLLMEDGTYDKPRGAIPRGLMWDKIRGMWAPPHLLTKKRSEDNPPSKRRSTHSMGGHDDNTVKEQECDDNKRSKERLYRGLKLSERRTSDGCLLPKREPAQCADGTYLKPKGHVPNNMIWDEIRGLWAPKGKTKGKLGSDTNRLSVSSSSDDDTNIIKASKAKLFHHSSFILRTYFQPKKRSRGNHSACHSHRFQARTKGNPSGIVKHTINLSNWRKIEKLMQRSTQQKNMAVPTATANAISDEGEVRLI
jgi:hypothetical protein